MIRQNKKELWLSAEWPAPAWIKAGITTRPGGQSEFPYESLNIALHVGDDADKVKSNRKRLSEKLSLPSEPAWLDQEHGNHIIDLNKPVNIPNADGSYTREDNIVCVIMTADCLPLLLCDNSGSEIAAVHIGWRGLSKNIVKIAVNKFNCKTDQILAWLGPCISKENYEVDQKVYNEIISALPAVNKYFTSTRKHHWLMDIRKIVSEQLYSAGLNHVYLSNFCTYTDSSLFYSHRRDGNTGRMASMIWMDSRSRMR